MFTTLSFYTAMSRNVSSSFEVSTAFSPLDTLKTPTLNIFNVSQHTAASKIFNYNPKPFKVKDLYPNYSRSMVHENESSAAKLKVEANKKIKANKEAEYEEIKSVELIQNIKIFPNPVQNHLSVSFELSTKSSIMIKITDILGNEVMTLLSATLEDGKFTKTFQISGKINAGTYFVRIIAAHSVKVARIIVQ